MDRPTVYRAPFTMLHYIDTACNFRVTARSERASVAAMNDHIDTCPLCGNPCTKGKTIGIFGAVPSFAYLPPILRRNL